MWVESSTKQINIIMTIKSKRILLSFAIIAMLAVAVGMGCTTSSQRTAYNSIYTVEQAANTAVDGYYTWVIKGLLPTNDVPTVAARFNQLQAACTLAAATTQAGTNAVAPATLTLELTDLVTFIGTLETKK